MSVEDNFLCASVENIKKGYFEEKEYFECMLCGKKIGKGIVYQQDGVLYESEKYMKTHIDKEHQSVFDYLINLDKKVTGLSEHQNALLRLFYLGKSDTEIQKEMGIGSSSTIRNHRFVLKEKERQAKVFLVLMELLKETDKKPFSRIEPHKTAKMVDDRYDVTVEENDKILKKYFPKGLEGELTTFSMKEKSKLVILRQLIKRFEKDRMYKESEVNEILKTAYADFATLRRYLIEYGFMDRTPNGGQYWIKEDFNEKEEKNVERKKELLLQYKETKKEAGIYAIKNTVNQKVLVLSTSNLKTMNGKRFQLLNGSHINKQLQEDVKLLGIEAFEFEILEVLKEKEDGPMNVKDELNKLELKWCEKLQTYGEKGYNVAPLPTKSIK